MAKGVYDLFEIIEKLYIKRQCDGFSLSTYCEALLEKPMSKFEQCSNWAARPLRKTQLHYAALDSYIMLVLHDKLEVTHPSIL